MQIEIRQRRKDRLPPVEAFKCFGLPGPDALGRRPDELKHGKIVAVVEPPVPPEILPIVDAVHIQEKNVKPSRNPPAV